MTNLELNPDVGADVHATAPLQGRALLLGALLGFALSRIGFTDYTQLHRMFTFTDLRLIAVFGGGVVVTAALLWTLRGRIAFAPQPFSVRAVVGGVVFGVGWAVAGACPGVAFAQLGEGKAWALVTLIGVVVGTAIADRFVGVRSSACG